MRILIIGYGKMGKTIEKLAIDYGWSIIGTVNNDNDLKDVNTENIDVAIEFSKPESAKNNLLWCINNQLPIVCGTTGWLDDWELIKNQILVKQGSMVYASNFSIGVNIFFTLNQYMAKIMKAIPEYKVHIAESHHIEKKDHPSGTAITLAEDILNQISSLNHWVSNDLNQEDNIPILSERLGGDFGTHIVKYHNKIDTIQIHHHAYSRQGFAKGALMAAEWIRHRKGIFDMQDVLNLKL